MRHRPKSLALTLGLAMLAVSTTPDPAPADIFVETAYLPSSYLSTSYLPTSYLSPTSYFPTSYSTTSDVLSTESVLYPTSTTYVRRSLFRPRRYVSRTFNSYAISPTSYLLPTSYSYVRPTTYLSTSSLMPTTYLSSSSLMPTTYLSSSSLMPTTYVSRSYVAPTSYVLDSDVITTSATSSLPCETSPMPTSIKAAPSRSSTSGDSGTTITSSPANGPSGGTERRPSGSVSNIPGGEEPPTSAVRSSEIPPPAQVSPPKPEATSPPTAPPLDEPRPGDLKMPEPGKSGTSAGPGEMSYRTARRPSGYDTRNILRGRVVSAESQLPEEGVTVILTSLTGNFKDRPAMTDALGEFKVSLPDGDWTVKVTMPSGRVYPVGRDYVTASSGRVIDSTGRNVADFLITR